jgi:hypothetical protein
MSVHLQSRTLQISNIPPDKLATLIERANECGTTPEEYALSLIVEALSPHGQTFDEILAPFRREVKEHGITDDQLDELCTRARRDYACEQEEKD